MKNKKVVILLVILILAFAIFDSIIYFNSKNKKQDNTNPSTNDKQVQYYCYSQEERENNLAYTTRTIYNIKMSEENSFEEITTLEFKMDTQEDYENFTWTMDNLKPLYTEELKDVYIKRYTYNFNSVKQNQTLEEHLKDLKSQGYDCRESFSE